MKTRVIEYVFVCDTFYKDNLALYDYFSTEIEMRLGMSVKCIDEISNPEPYEILFGAKSRDAYKAIADTLAVGEYAIEVQHTEDSTKIILAYNGVDAALSVIDAFFTNYITDTEIVVPSDAKVRGSTKYITIDTPLRDPFLLLDNGVYYLYGTGWICYSNTSGSLRGEWNNVGRVVDVPADAVDNYWAPEVYRYNGGYYMFTTYLSATTGHRGCSVFRADSPAGPFVEISDGPVTPSDWDCIDGTLYIDPNGQPWMVFCHEWTGTDDGVGRMSVAKMSDDLTSLITEPIDLFRADDPAWTDQIVTDGCFLYTCENGQLLMLWSNFEEGGYCVSIANSADGRVDGEWIQAEAPFFNKSIYGMYDGGHAMIFTDTDGQLYLVLHAPNAATKYRKELPVLIPIREENGTLVLEDK